MDGDRLVRDASREWLRKGVESSLHSLRTDYIDLYQVHWPDLHTPPEETAGALEELVAEGKIRHVGVSNYDTEQMRAFSRFGQVETLQPAYHLFRRDIEETILPYTADHDMGVLVYGPMAHGLLSGRMTESTTFDFGDWRSKSPDFTGETFRRNLAVVEQLKGVAQDRDISLRHHPRRRRARMGPASRRHAVSATKGVVPAVLAPPSALQPACEGFPNR